MLSLGQKRPEGLPRGSRLTASHIPNNAGFFCLLGPRLTFGFIGWLGNRRYHKSSPAKVIRRNVELVYAHMPADQRETIIEGIYDNVPRAMAEFILQPYWKRYGPRRTRHNLDADWLQPYLNNERQALFLLGHMAGWEAGA